MTDVNSSIDLLALLEVVTQTIDASPYSKEVKDRATLNINLGLFEKSIVEPMITSHPSISIDHRGMLDNLKQTLPLTKERVIKGLREAVSFGKYVRGENIRDVSINSEDRVIENQASLLTQHVAKTVAQHLGIGFSDIVRTPATSDYIGIE